jgi:hypothetical protein
MFRKKIERLPQSLASARHIARELGRERPGSREEPNLNQIWCISPECTPNANQFCSVVNRGTANKTNLKTLQF